MRLQFICVSTLVGHHVLALARMFINRLLAQLKSLGLIKSDTGGVLLVNSQCQLIVLRFHMAQQLLAQTFALIIGVYKQRSQLMVDG